MMGELDAIGDLVTGGVIARSVEPDTGTESLPGRDGHTHEHHCLNCGAALVGAYCQDCGQHAHVHRTLGAFFHDLLHGILHVDGKLWRTVPLLAWRPGELTRRYIDGERAKFVSPMALFLFTIFLTYAVFGALNDRVTFLNLGDNKESMEKAIYEARTEVVTAEAKLQEARAERRDTRAAQTELDEARKDVSVLERMKTKGVSAVALDEASMKAPSNKAEKSLGGLVKMVRENPSLYAYKIQTSAYKYSWLLIPISVPFLWLLFPFSRRFYLYDHTVFVTYSITFMTVLVMAATIAGMTNHPIVLAAFALFMPVHMYRQLKGTYGLGRLSAILRTTILTIFSLAALGLFAAAIVAMVSH